MTVKELIAELRDVPEDLPVCLGTLGFKENFTAFHLLSPIDMIGLSRGQALRPDDRKKYPDGVIVIWDD